VAFTLKNLGAFLAPGVTAFYFVQLFQIAAFAVITVASVYYTDAIMSPEDAIKGQAYFALTSTVGAVLCSIVGGWLIDAKGVDALLLLTIGFSAVGAVIMVFGVLSGHTKQESLR
jgi:PPP family 3-phenylpropionic acid transporter